MHGWKSYNSDRQSAAGWKQHGRWLGQCRDRDYWACQGCSWRSNPVAIKKAADSCGTGENVSGKVRKTRALETAAKVTEVDHNKTRNSEKQNCQLA